MKVNHNIEIGRTPVGQAALEMLSDEIAVAHSHYRDLTTDNSKPTTITIIVKMTPAPGGFGMDYDVSAKSTAAPRKSFATRMYANSNTGQLSITEFDPVQLDATDDLRMPVK